MQLPWQWIQKVSTLERPMTKFQSLSYPMPPLHLWTLKGSMLGMQEAILCPPAHSTHSSFWWQVLQISWNSSKYYECTYHVDSLYIEVLLIVSLLYIWKKIKNFLFLTEPSSQWFSHLHLNQKYDILKMGRGKDNPLQEVNS